MTGRRDEPAEGPAQAAATARGFRDGDPEAVAEVRRRVRRILKSRGWGIPRQERRDLEQNVLLQVWQRVGQPGFDGGRFWAMVEVVAARRVIDWLRRRRGWQVYELPPVLPDPGPEPLGAALERERARLARAALERLPESCQELIRLQVGGGRTYGEIARILGKSEGALRVQMHRCVQRARDIVDGLLAGEDPAADPGAVTESPEPRSKD